MKILIIDIETAGLTAEDSPIVEIGLQLVDTETKEITELFNQVIKEDMFDSKNWKHTSAWIFKNSNLKVSDVMKAKSLEYYREELQGYFNQYHVTAYNVKFDMTFMRSRGFILTEVKDLMAAAKQYVKVLAKDGKVKNPSLMEAYKHFFPNDGYIEKHRGSDDAYHEAKILLEMVKIKKEKKSTFANEFE